jgi:Na+/phosphate symporter
MLIRLIEEFTIFILIIQIILLSFFLIILFKRYKNLFDGNSLTKTLNDKIDKIDKINSTIYNISTLKKEIFSERYTLQRHLSDLHTSLEKINASILNINNILNSESSSNFRFTSSSHNNIQNKLENKIDFASDVKSNFTNKEKGILEQDINNTNNIDYKSTNPNNSINELKALEKEIFIALKRLENTESNSESNEK